MLQIFNWFWKSDNEIISDAKKKILIAIDSAGGSVESLDQLEKISGFGKPLLSYHVHGSKDAKRTCRIRTGRYRERRKK